MGCNARREYQARYTVEQNYEQLTMIYASAVARRAAAEADPRAIAR
jgi:hypothetical protein